MVDNAGNVTDLKVYVVSSTGSYADGIAIEEPSGERIYLTGVDPSPNFYAMPSKVKTTSQFATVKPASGADGTHYIVQAVITDLDLRAEK